MLAAALLVLDEGGRQRLVKRLDKDTGATLLAVLEAKRGSGWRRPAPQRPSPSRILQNWRLAWRYWDNAICETQGEHGEYVVQDHHWEQPNIDQCALSGQLEGVAGTLLELMPRVIEDDLAVGFSFLDKLEESAEEVGSGMPEWFDEPEWDSLFGPVVTSSLLHWEWFSASTPADGGQEARSPFAIVDRIRRAEDRSDRWSVDADALMEFVLALGEEDQLNILRGIEAHGNATPHWRDALEHARGTWFDLVQALAEARHLAPCVARGQHGTRGVASHRHRAHRDPQESTDRTGATRP